MKTIKRIVSLLLVCLMFGSMAALAVDTPVQEYVLSEEKLAKIYDPDNYTQREYVPGRVMVCFKRPVADVGSYEELFPELSIDKINSVMNFKKCSFVDISLKEVTKEAVVEAIQILKERSDIAYAQPSYTSGFFMEGVVIGDVNQNGEVDNPDLILTARYVVDLAVFSEAEKYLADMTGDGEISNADIISVARVIVGNPVTTKPMLTEERARELNQIMVAKYNTGISQMNYYGVYNGCEIARIVRYGGGLEAVVKIEVAGRTFTYPNYYTATYVFSGQDVLRIDEAYEAGWISAEDVDNLCSNLVGPLPQVPPERLMEIFRAYAKYTGVFSHKMSNYGQYSDCDIQLIKGSGVYTEAEYHIQVAGCDFRFAHGGVGLYAFKGNECLSIDKAYEAGWLTDEDIAEIWSLGSGEITYHKWIGDSYGNPVVDEYYPSREFYVL